MRRHLHHFKPDPLRPRAMSHHITTHPKGILAEVAGMAEICGSGSLTLAAVRLQSQNSKNTVRVPNAVNAGEKVSHFSRYRPEPVIQ
jgi:hypothetical protein